MLSASGNIPVRCCSSTKRGGAAGDVAGGVDAAPGRLRLARGCTCSPELPAGGGSEGNGGTEVADGTKSGGGGADSAEIAAAGI